MDGFFAFFHIIGIIVWLSSLISLAILLPMLKPNLDTKLGKKLIRNIIYTFKAMIHVASIVVLISGTYRVFQLDLSVMNNPFWISYMINIGWVATLLGMILIEVLGRRVTIPLYSQINTLKESTIGNRLFTYVSAVVVIMLMVISIILVVSFKL